MVNRQHPPRSAVCLLAVALGLCAVVLVSAGVETGATSTISAEGTTTFGSSYAPTLVQTTNGPVEGTLNFWKTARVFHGIPYAAPPVGPLRFKDPVDPEPWTKTKPTKHSIGVPACAQIEFTKWAIVGHEDCLYLHVYTPSRIPANKPLPVMVWFYGGGYAIGSGTQDGWYDGENVASKRDVIIVAMNYRLGAFGFLAHEELRKEQGQSGSFGVLDQRHALKWVQKNIAKFGGDADNVTIFGQSAGGFSVCFHYVSPQSQGLFHKAIMESGSCDSPQFFQPQSVAEQWGQYFSRNTTCGKLHGEDWLSCVRGLKTSVLMETVIQMLKPIAAPVADAYKDMRLPLPVAGSSVVPFPSFAPLMPWGPVVDGSDVSLPDLPLTLLEKGQFAKVPIIMGTAKDEGSIFVVGVPFVVKGVYLPLSTASVRKVVQHIFNDTYVDQVLKLYTDQHLATNEEIVSHLIRDFFFTCGTRRTARAIAKHGVSSFLYQFRYPLRWIDGKLFGDYHTSELYFVWDNAWPPVVHPFNKNDKAMADAFGTYWTNMAKFGNPNGAPGTVGSHLQWPLYDEADDTNMMLDVPLKTASRLESAVCDVFDTLRSIP